MRRSFRQLQVETNHSVLLFSLGRQRTWLVPTRDRQLCSVETTLTANRRFDGGGMGCSGVRSSEIHGFNLYISRTCFAEVLPKHSSPVLVSYKDGASTLLRADRDGIVRATFNRPVRLISYTGPTGVKTHFTPPPAAPQPAKR